MSQTNRNTKRRRSPRPAKPAKPGTPIRNGILLIIFVAVVVLMVVLLPKEPTLQSSTVLAPGDGDGTGAVAQEELSLRISEVMSSNKGAYPDEKGNYPDWIEIENTGGSPINLQNVGLSDREDRVLFLFPNIEIPANGFVIVFCDDINQNAPGTALHARFKVSALGESLFLFDPNAVPIDSVEVPAMNSDFSYALTPGGWIITEQYTPEYPNTEVGYTTFRSESLVSASGLMLNEVLASNRTTIQDEDGEYPDWIELYNSSSVAIDLHNYCLSDDDSNLTKWRFPSGAVIQPGEYYLVYASGKDKFSSANGVPHTNFKLAAEGETVVLSDILSQVIDRATYENLGKDVSWGRQDGSESSWIEYQQPTPGLPNNRQSEMEMDQRMRARNSTGIYISEVVSSSTGLDTPYGNTSYDWIEIVNLSQGPVNLKDWGLSDSIGRPRKWQFGDVSLGAGEYLLIFPSGLTASPTGSGAIHADFRLSALGETVVLSRPDGTIVDKLVVPKLERDTSYGRNFDQGGLFYYDTPTAAAVNNTVGFSGYAQAPKIEKPGGIFLGTVEITVSALAGVSVRYTLDGSEPTQTNGLDYTGAISLDQTAPLRVRGFVDGLKPSDIVTETYLINAYPSLPVVALTVDPDDLWNPESGMLAEDPELKATYEEAPFEDLVYWQKNRYPGNFEYYLADGTQILNQVVEVQLNGQFSLDHAQKSFRITARKRYGNATLAYPFFEDRPFMEYQAVILRNGGNDGRYTRIVDALQSKIIDWTGADIMHMASRPIIVYLNGDYWGHYNLRERMNKYSIAAYEGWDDPELIDFIKGDDDVISGDYKNYGELISFVKEHDLKSDPEALQTVLDWVDVDNYFDFMIFEIYFGNTDTGNIKFYRQRVEGAKWRWIVYDLDWGYFRYAVDTTRSWLKPEGSGSLYFENVLIRKLLEVPELQDKFLRRYGELFQGYFSDTPRIRALVDEMVAEIEPELTMHFQRWAGLTSPIITEEPATPEGNLRYWRDRVSRLHNLLKMRPNYAWQHAKDWFELTDEQMLDYFGPQPEIPADAIP